MRSNSSKSSSGSSIDESPPYVECRGRTSWGRNWNFNEDQSASMKPKLTFWPLQTLPLCLPPSRATTADPASGNRAGGTACTPGGLQSRASWLRVSCCSAAGGTSNGRATAFNSAPGPSREAGGRAGSGAGALAGDGCCGRPFAPGARALASGGCNDRLATGLGFCGPGPRAPPRSAPVALPAGERPPQAASASSEARCKSACTAAPTAARSRSRSSTPITDSAALRATRSRSRSHSRSRHSRSSSRRCSRSRFQRLSSSFCSRSRSRRASAPLLLGSQDPGGRMVA
mmetsp:Transcript_12502/g.44218  ORF Transcript_12502/g.44218 Transcript_12502/m.44218 type:complete len:287 (-) Transcript_12502:1277-2137(-)